MTIFRVKKILKTITGYVVNGNMTALQNKKRLQLMIDAFLNGSCNVDDVIRELNATPKKR